MPLTVALAAVKLAKFQPKHIMTGPGDIGYGPALDAINKRLDTIEENVRLIASELLYRDVPTKKLREIAQGPQTETDETKATTIIHPTEHGGVT